MPFLYIFKKIYILHFSLIYEIGSDLNDDINPNDIYIFFLKHKN